MLAEQELVRDSHGNPVLEGMCGNVLCGRFDPRLPFFTENGSFWRNSTTQLLASTTEADRQGPTRNRCNRAGYESVALVRMSFAGRTLGLLQFNDKRKGRFTRVLLEFLERVGAALATALEQRSVNAALRDSEERYRSLFENMREGYAYCKMEFHAGKPVDWEYLAVNEAFEVLTGLKGVVGKKVSEVIPGVRESNPELLGIYGGVSLTGKPETFEDYVAPLGIWFSISVYSAGRGYFVAVFDNITERKRAEEALQESEQRYRQLFENSQLGIYRTTPDGQVLLANPALLAMLGYASLEDLAGHNLEEEAGFQPEYDRHEFRCTVEDQGELRGHEAGWRQRNGNIVYIRENTKTVRGADGAVLYYDGTVEDITEHKRAEEELRASEKRYRLIAENTADVIWTLDVATGRTTYVSPSIERLRGYSPIEVLNQSLEEVLTPESYRRALALLAERIAALEGGDESARISVVELDNKCRDGSIVATEAVAKLVTDDRGRVREVLGVTRDITERKRAEQALWESEGRARRLAEMLERSSQPVVTAYTDGRLNIVNAAYCGLLGYNRDELQTLSQTVDLTPPEWREKEAEVLELLHRERKPIRYQKEYIRKDGTRVPVEILVHLDPNPAEGAPYYYAFVTDLTERKRAAEALRLSEKRFRQVADDAEVFVWEVDAEGLYTYASTVVETILGYVPDELVGKLHFYDLFAPEVREQIKAVAIQGIAEKRPFQSFLASSLKKDGSTVMLEKSGTPMLDEAGNLIGYRGADRDVTGRVRAMEELRQHRDHLEQIVKERTAEIEAESSKLAIEVVERTLVVEAYKRSEARLQLQFDSMPLACITIGRNLKLQAWNPAAVRIFGYTATEAVGAPVIDLIVPEDIRPEVDALLRTLLEGKESVRNVNDNATKDGRRITCEWTNTPLLDPDRSRQGLLCMVEDITLRRQAEEGLKRKTVELEAFNKAMIGREKRLIELKEELNRLCLEVGRPPAYPPVWRDEDESADSP